MTLEELDNVEDVYPLTPMQQGMLFHTLEAPSSNVFVNQARRRVKGSFEPEALEAAYQALIDRHAALRTAFLWDGLDRPLQVVREHAELDWTQLDWSSVPAGEFQQRLEAFLSDDAQRGFDLASAPLTRVTLIKQSDREWHWIWTTHHMIADGWSARIMLDELLEDYQRGGSLPRPDPFPFRDFVAAVLGRDDQADEAFWTERLRGFTSPHRLSVPGRRPDATAKGHDSHVVTLDRSLSDAARDLARAQRVTLNTVFMGLWSLVLSRWMRETDVVFGVTSSGRDGGESGVGLYINTLPARVEVDRSMAAGDWLRSLQQSQLAMFPYEQASLAAVQQWSEVPPGEPLFESLFVFENLPPMPSEAASGIEITDVGFDEHSNYPLAVLVYPDEEISIRFVYDASRLTRADVESLGEQVRTGLGQMSTGASLPLEQLSVTPPGDVPLLATWSSGPEVPTQDLLIHELIQEQARLKPESPAVRFQGAALSYEQLDQAANAVAAALQSAGVGRDDLVGLFVPRSPEMVIGILAVLKAGGAYVPLDPDYPPSHIERLHKSEGIGVVLCDDSVADKLPHAERVVSIQAALRDDASPSPSNSGADDLAYVIHTSGSTGLPKGVMVSHRNLVASTRAREAHYRKPVGRFLLLSSFAFDSSMVGLFWTLCSGGTIVLPAGGQELEVERTLALAAAEQVTHLLALPSLFQLLLDHDAHRLASLEVAIVAGEACPPDLVASHMRSLPQTELHNEYGPTEATVWCTAHQAEASDAGRPLPIGRPIAGSRIYVLDEHGHQAPVGFAGEIAVAGAGLARGYLNQPELTAERFLDVEVADRAERVYRTGDLGCFGPDGSLLFLGRTDTQLKIRGHRIEGEAVEAALRAHPMVREAAVAGATTRAEPVSQLVAYVLAAEHLDQAQVKRDLQSKLPRFMVPDVIAAVDELPRLPNGKVDHKRLPNISAAVLDTGEKHVAPSTEAEKALASLWADVLGVDQARIGAGSDFFELGGHSLLAIRLLSAVHKRFETSLPLSTLFEAPSLGELARVLDGGRDTASSSLVVPIREAGEPAVFFIHPGGGNVLVYEPVVRHLPGHLSVFGIQARGVEGVDEPDRTFQAMAARYADAIAAFRPSRPIHLVGYSTGGLIAYETARILSAKGHTVGLVGLLDTVFPLGAGYRERRAAELAIVKEGRLRAIRTVLSWWWAYLRSIGGRVRHGPKWSFLAARGRALPPGLAGKRINHIALRAHREYQPDAYGGRVTLIRAAGDAHRRFHGSLPKWLAVAPNLVVRDASGRHAGKGNMVTEPHAATVAEIVADEIAFSAGSLDLVSDQRGPA